MKAEIIAIGSELTCGARLDTNSPWLSSELEKRGYTVHRHTTIADDHSGLVRCFQEASQRSRLVLVTGGLGPTLDDITRDTLAEAFQQPLVEDLVSLNHIQAMFVSRGREMPERNKVQALRPEKSECIHNAHGTAPGVLMEFHDPECMIAVMPGVPSEMERMFLEQVQQRIPRSPQIIQRSVIRTFGYGESDTERLLGDLTARGRNPEVGITASQAVISLSITAQADSEEACQQMTESMKQLIHQKLGSAVFADGEAEMCDVVASHLLGNNLKIALLEGPATGGLLGQWFTEREDYAEALAYSRMFPTAAAIHSEANSADRSWQQHLQEEAEKLVNSGTADYVIFSSPSQILEKDGVRIQNGSVVVLGLGLHESCDVSMTGNLTIFRGRAARHALNILRLHLLKTA